MPAQGVAAFSPRAAELPRSSAAVCPSPPPRPMRASSCARTGSCATRGGNGGNGGNGGGVATHTLHASVRGAFGGGPLMSASSCARTGSQRRPSSAARFMPAAWWAVGSGRWAVGGGRWVMKVGTNYTHSGTHFREQAAPACLAISPSTLLVETPSKDSAFAHAHPSCTDSGMSETSALRS